MVLQRIAATDTARGKQEPIHENPLAIVVWVVSQQTMPLVFLLTAAFAGTSIRLDFAKIFVKISEILGIKK